MDKTKLLPLLRHRIAYLQTTHTSQQRYVNFTRRLYGISRQPPF